MKEALVRPPPLCRTGPALQRVFTLDSIGPIRVRDQASSEVVTKAHSVSGQRERCALSRRSVPMRCVSTEQNSFSSQSSEMPLKSLSLHCCMDLILHTLKALAKVPMDFDNAGSELV